MSTGAMTAKVSKGQFYTKGNPFMHPAFLDWIASTGLDSDAKIIEPFGGANHIIKLVAEAGLPFTNWTSYDIDPEAIEENVAPQYPLRRRDTIADFPTGFDISITNPPYLAKNSAKRKKIDVEFGSYQDLYQVALRAILDSVPYVAAIIPESFLTSKQLKERCVCIISLPHKMFDDTEHPVCLALFDPRPSSFIMVYSGLNKLGTMDELRKAVAWMDEAPELSPRLTFNDPQGELGFRAIDSTSRRTIEFFRGDKIPSESIKVSSRALTRIGIHREIDLDSIISRANELIERYRDATQDALLTPFKGLRKDGLYRRRMDFATASRILSYAIRNETLPKL